MIPKACFVSRKGDTLTFSYTALGVLTFDPQITTSSATVIKFKPDDAPETVKGPSTAHSFSYTPSAGDHTCKVTLMGGYGSVTSIDINSDGVTDIKNLDKCRNMTTFIGNNNPGLVLSLSSLSSVTYYLALLNCVLVTGNLSDVAGVTYFLNLGGCPLIEGNLSSLSANTFLVGLASCPLVTGTYVPDITSLDISNSGADQTRVDAIIDFIYQAVLLDPNHFTSLGPMLYMTANDATPSGVYQVATPPTTGLEKVYYICHLAAHCWSVEYNGGSAP